MNNKQNGFSLYEIFISLAIIVLLAGVIVFSYSSYIEKSKVVKLVNVTSQMRLEIAQQVAKYRKLPNADDIGVFMQKLLSDFNINNPTLTLTYEYKTNSNNSKALIKLFLLDSSANNNTDNNYDTEKILIENIEVFNGEIDFSCGTTKDISSQLSKDLLPLSCTEVFTLSELEKDYNTLNVSVVESNETTTNNYVSPTVVIDHEISNDIPTKIDETCEIGYETVSVNGQKQCLSTCLAMAIRYQQLILYNVYPYVIAKMIGMSKEIIVSKMKQVIL